MEKYEFLVAVKSNGAFVMQNYTAETVRAFRLNAGESAIAADTLGKLWYLANVGGTQTATDITTVLNGKLDSAEKGVAGGVATLGSDGKVSASQLPSFVDDVVDSYIVPDSVPFSAGWLSKTNGGAAMMPEVGKIYVILSEGDYTNKTYRWSGTLYVEISPSLVIGTTPGTAYDGGAGTILKNTLDAHIANTSNPHRVTKAQLGLDDVANHAKPGLTIQIPAASWVGASAPYTVTIPRSAYLGTANGMAAIYLNNVTGMAEYGDDGTITLTSNVKKDVKVLII